MAKATGGNIFLAFFPHNISSSKEAKTGTQAGQDPRDRS